MRRRKEGYDVNVLAFKKKPVGADMEGRDETVERKVRTALRGLRSAGVKIHFLGIYSHGSPDDIALGGPSARRGEVSGGLRSATLHDVFKKNLRKLFAQGGRGEVMSCKAGNAIAQRLANLTGLTMKAPPPGYGVLYKRTLGKRIPTDAGYVGGVLWDEITTSWAEFVPEE
jgi:hypothetical protein